MKWLFVGGGNMASSLIGGLLQGATSASDIAVADPDSSTCQRIESHFGISSAPDIEAAMFQLIDKQNTSSRIAIVIAVKPNIVEPVCRAISDFFGDNAATLTGVEPLCISVAAGVRENALSGWLPSNMPLVRCMPNTPALLGLGITALFANTQCSEQDRDDAGALLNNAGQTIWVDDELKLDAVTAVSGSGPAYFFYLIEHMAKTGTELGLEPDIAETLAIETAFGAASMARTRQSPPSILRENVTSKGGTTAAALDTFNMHGTPEVIRAAIVAAHRRAVEIGDELT